MFLPLLLGIATVVTLIISLLIIWHTIICYLRVSMPCILPVVRPSLIERQLFNMYDDHSACMTSDESAQMLTRNN